MKINLKNGEGISFALKQERILKGFKVVWEEGELVVKSCYEHSLNEQATKDWYLNLVSELSGKQGGLVVYGVRKEKEGRVESMDVLDVISGENLKEKFASGKKVGLGRYEWLKEKLMQNNYKRIELRFGEKN